MCATEKKHETHEISINIRDRTYTNRLMNVLSDSMWPMKRNMRHMKAVNQISDFYMRNQTASLLVFIFLFSTCFCSSASGQKEFGFSMPSGSKRVEIAFEEYNNLIVIPITLNGFLTLKFILDTGVETAILTEKLYADIIDVNYVRELKIAGPGINDSVEVYVANELTFNLPGGLVGKNMNMLVLEEDYLELAENMGEEVYGIIGYDIFSRFTVEVNYDSKRLILHDPRRYKPKRRSTTLPIEVRRGKPYLKTSITQEKKKKALDIMIDTGASHAALLDFGGFEANLVPEERIVTRLGTGIAGEIPGYLSRLDTLSIGQYSFDEVLYSAPLEGTYNKTIKRGSKYGTIGGGLLHRFNVTFDYTNEKMYLQKASRYKDSFEHDMSGMTLNARGQNLDTLKIESIRKDSPADLAGLKTGDIILSINSKSLRNSRLSEIFAMLRKKEGIKIKCKVLRDGQKLRRTFRLKRLI
ncbi:MAG: aspartyl protease family protein [Bacteroidota bacterium]